MSQCGVLVCGAGPVGLTAALELVRHGVRPRIIDANDAPTEMSKALVVWRRTLKALDSGVSFERFLESHDAVESAKFTSEGREIAKLDLTEGQESNHAIPTGVLIPQSATEQLLLQALAQHGIEVERATRLTSFKQLGDGVEVTIESGVGSEQSRVDWLLGCDGGHSSIRKGLGLEFPGESLDHLWLIGDVSIDQESNARQIQIEFDSHGLVAMFPIGTKRWRIFADLGKYTEKVRKSNLNDVQRVLDERTSTGWTATEAHWLSHYTVNERQIEEYKHGRVVLAGDSAHVHSPAGGQGMNTGMQDAQNIAWKLALYMRGGAGESLLNTYQEERHPIGRFVVEGSGRLLKSAMLTNVVARTARNTLVHFAMAVPMIRRRFRDALSEDALDYCKSSLSDGSGSKRLRSGEMLPNATVEVDGEEVSLYHLLRGNSVTLIVVGDSIPEGLPERFGYDEAGFQIEVKRLGPGGDAEDPEGATSALLGGEGSLVLLRPDAVVATMTNTPGDIKHWIDTRLIDGVLQR